MRCRHVTVIFVSQSSYWRGGERNDRVEHPHPIPDQRAGESHSHPWRDPALLSALGLLPLRLFLAAGWMRAGAEKFIDHDWWTGATLRDFLAAQHDVALPYFRPVMDHAIGPFAVEVAAVVAVAQIMIGLAILVGRPLRLALWAGVVLNVVFVMCGRVNPSAFYLVMEAALLYGISTGTVARSVKRPSTRSLGLVAMWLALAVVDVPFIRTLEPAKVIDDPAMMLTFLCVVVAITTLLRWMLHHVVAITVVTGVDLGPVRSWLLCRASPPTPEAAATDELAAYETDWAKAIGVELDELATAGWAPPTSASIGAD